MRRPPRSTRTDTLVPYTTLFRSPRACALAARSDRRLRLRAALPVRRRSLPAGRSEEHTYELQSLMRISYAVFCLKKKNHTLASERDERISLNKAETVS